MRHRFPDHERARHSPGARVIASAHATIRTQCCIPVETAVCCRMPLPRHEPDDRDLPPHRLGPIVAVPGVDLLGERVQACVFVGISDLGRQKSLEAEFALGVPLQVVIPLRMFGFPRSLTRSGSDRFHRGSR